MESEKWLISFSPLPSFFPSCPILDVHIPGPWSSFSEWERRWNSILAAAQQEGREPWGAVKKIGEEASWGLNSDYFPLRYFLWLLPGLLLVQAVAKNKEQERVSDMLLAARNGPTTHPGLHPAAHPGVLFHRLRWSQQKLREVSPEDENVFHCCSCKK